MPYICEGIKNSHKVQYKYIYKYCVQHNYSLKHIDPNKYAAFLMIISEATKIVHKVSILNYSKVCSQ